MRAIGQHRLVLLMVIALLVGGVLACEIGGGPSKPTLNVTAPTSGAEVELGEEVSVLSTATDSKGVTRMELAVDGVLYRTDASPSVEGEQTWTLAQTWTAEEVGSYTLTVTAYNVDGVASDSWAISIRVVEEGEEAATPTSTSGPPPAATNTPEPPPPAATDTPQPPTDTPEPPPTDTPEPPPTDTPPPALPDLYVSGLLVSPPDPGWGGSVQVRFDVGNQGDAPSGPYKVIWRYGTGDFDVIEENKPSLPPGSGGTINWTLDEIYASYNTVAAVDPFNDVEESDEGNNQAEFMVNVGPLEADLYISEIRLVPPSPQQGSPVMVGVHIRNRGGTDAGAFRVIWRAAGPTLGCEWNVASLDAGAERWQQCEFTYAGWNPNYTTTAIVDVDNEVVEADETNNEKVLMVNVRPD